MKIRFTELPVGSCFLQGRNASMKKKVADRRVAVVREDGRIRYRKQKGDPDVEESPCTVRYLGVGLRKIPETLVEIGDGNVLEARGRKRGRKA